MAEGCIWPRDQFSCSVCLDVLKDPVTIPCGHSYCMSCITICWNQDDQKRVYSCPQCRQTFTPRPALNKNVTLAEIVERLKKAKTALSYAGPGDVGCDFCTGRKRKAVKSCLMCLESYCQSHFKCHEESRSRKRHKVTDATRRIQEMICPQHDRLLEVYCRTDQRCICLMCMLDEHKNHDTVPAEAERTEKQKKVGEIQGKFQQRVQERQKELRGLREAVETHKRSAQAAVEDSERIFTELICSIEKSRSEVTQMIRDQEQAEVSRAEGLLKRLEQEIDDLRRRDAELEQVSHTDNHIYFLQSVQSLSVPPGSTDSISITSLTFDDVEISVARLRGNLEDFCDEEIEYIYDKDSHQLTLDPNTANKKISLSWRNRVATRKHTVRPYPDHPDRFDVWPQVLCRESVCGRCYWEVEWSGGAVGISVSYKSISRKGRGDKFGCNDQSWRLFCSRSKYLFCTNYKKTKLNVMPKSSTIGVYVDHSAGNLSFYSISDTMTLIHRVQTTFTQPLYPGFLLYQGSSVKLAK
ncbi:Tripartite motif-containing protein 16 [Anabarilius grahami]|uniref:Tripartite motif-containing protein 16 n=1 Tax=Anabarilius grahami TaxID=495550 RepID=A0A3N0YPJ5_ANAGA|nr:Tripartite motif-containing protein 16 [Anabarilius grahami]